MESVSFAVYVHQLTSFSFFLFSFFFFFFLTNRPGEQNAANPDDPNQAASTEVDHQLSQRRQELQLQWEEARLRRYMAITEAFIRQGGRAPDLSMLES